MKGQKREEGTISDKKKRKREGESGMNSLKRQRKRRNERERKAAEMMEPERLT